MFLILNIKYPLTLLHILIKMYFNYVIVFVIYNIKLIINVVSSIWIKM